MAGASQMVAPILEAARSRDVGPSMLRCAAQAAAAATRPDDAAALLRRIAADERLLRFWALDITGTTGSQLLRRGMFPWTHILAAPAVKDARAELDSAYNRARDEARRLLRVLP